MRDYLGLFLVLAGLLGVLAWVRFSTPQSETESSAISSQTSTILARPTFPKKTVKAAPIAKLVRKTSPVVKSEANSTPVSPVNSDTLTSGIFQEGQKAETSVTALGIPVDAYLQDQKTRFPHATVYKEKNAKLRLFVQCWEMKDPSPEILTSSDCQRVLSNKRIDTSVRLY